ncbi:hypothetical protein KR038_002318, partial [Drosophila bunnanda]
RAEANGSDEDQASKRKSPQQNAFDENNQNKRLKPEESESGVPIKIEPNPDTPVEVKTEPVDNDDGVEAESAPDAASSNGPGNVQVKVEPPVAAVVKVEPANSNGQASDDSTVSSSSLRPSCRFGIRCYRRNPAHRSAEAHPGDSDYRRPNFPEPPLGTPACPFGNACYRRNPVHFQQHSHPADFNSAQNIRNRLRQRRAQRKNGNSRPADEDDFGTDDEDSDPFGGDNDDDVDYRPGADIDEDEEDELEFDSQRINSDDYD